MIIVTIGFVLRAIAGIVAIGVSLGLWLIVSTFLHSLVLALGKRLHELELEDDSETTRVVLGDYSRKDLEQLLMMTMATLLMRTQCVHSRTLTP